MRLLHQEGPHGPRLRGWHGLTPTARCSKRLLQQLAQSCFSEEQAVISSKHPGAEGASLEGDEDTAASVEPQGLSQLFDSLNHP